MIKLAPSFVRLPKHIIHPSGKAKTVCVTACLTALGIPVDSFNYTGTISKPNYTSILGKHFNYRSRKSSVAKTIGKARGDIKRLNEEAYYFVVVWGSGYCHAMILDNEGKTVIDTAPRSKDKRKIHSIHAIFKKS